PDLGSNGLPMEIGGNPELFDMNWNGLVDDVAVWNRALTTGELRQIWNTGRGVPIAALVVGTDGDNDGMSDAYESAHGLNTALDDAALDLDGDGLSNLEEHASGSHPNNPDTDGDGLDDDAEAAAGTNPLGTDSDGDGLSDGEEISGSQNPVLNGSLRDPFDPASDPREILPIHSRLTRTATSGVIGKRLASAPTRTTKTISRKSPRSIRSAPEPVRSSAAT
ncbi:MAG: hypothetical protein VCA34_00485, partial [Roseibacillus sp.]